MPVSEIDDQEADGSKREKMLLESGFSYNGTHWVKEEVAYKRETGVGVTAWIALAEELVMERTTLFGLQRLIMMAGQELKRELRRLAATHQDVEVRPGKSSIRKN